MEMRAHSRSRLRSWPRPESSLVTGTPSKWSTRCPARRNANHLGPSGDKDRAAGALAGGEAGLAGAGGRQVHLVHDVEADGGAWAGEELKRGAGSRGRPRRVTPLVTSSAARRSSW